MQLRSIAVLAILALGGARLFCPTPAWAQTRIESYHGAWTVRCNLRGKQVEACGVSNRKLTGLEGVHVKTRVQIFIYRFRGRWFLQLITPGNVDREKGVRLELDSQYVTTMPIVKCDVFDPCRAQLPFTAALQKRFLAAKTARFEFGTERRPRFEMTVKLNGLAEAMDALAKR